MTAPAVVAEGLTKTYGDTTVVDGLDLEVAPGEVFGLLGPNGAGKTTTILMLLGLTERTGGRALVAGFDPAEDPLEVKRRVGYLPDDVGFYETMTARQNLRYTARLNGLDRGTAEDRIADLLDTVGLSEAADRPAGTFSRGMRQRLGIADALVADPDVVILDEPTIAIDPRGVEEMLALITDLARTRGAAVLLSSHLLDQVEQTCDRVAIFVSGTVRAQGSRADLAAAESGGSHVVTVELADPGAVREGSALLAGVNGVVSAAPVGEGSASVTVTATEDVRARLAPVLMAGGLDVVGLRSREISLAQVYRRHFTEAAAASTPEEVAA